MNTVKQNIGFILNLYKEQRLDSYTRNVVNTAFDRQTVKRNMKYMQFKSQYITPEHFSLHFNSSGLIQDRLAFLICIIGQVLEYNSSLHHGVPSPSESYSQSHLPCLPLSDTLCRLCQTPHQDPKNGKGRKWHKGICRPFMELTFEDKPNFLKKEHLCKSLYILKAGPIHGDALVHLPRAPL